MNKQLFRLSSFGFGISPSNLPESVSMQMTDSVEDFEYARNFVTFDYGLGGFKHSRLQLEVIEYGDEPQRQRLSSMMPLSPVWLMPGPRYAEDIGLWLSKALPGRLKLLELG